MSEVSAALIEPATPRSQAERAYDLLVDRITRLELAPGQVLYDRELTQELGIGRTPVREALQRLASEGLVTHFPHRGMVVSEIGAATTRDIYEFRSLIDGEAARLAASRASPEEIENLRLLATQLAECAESEGPSDYVELDRAYYRLLGRACRNQFIADSIPKIFNLHLRLWFYIAGIKGGWQVMAGAHSEMIGEMSEAIERRDADAAQIAVRAYVVQRLKDMRALS